jgi:hypothetical protein
MRDSIDAVIFKMVQLPKGDPRRVQLEWEIISAYPGVHGLIEALDAVGRIGRALTRLLYLAGFGWLRPWLIEILHSGRRD